MCMSRSRILIAAIFLACLFALPARAGLLSGELVGDDVVAVLWLDAARLDPVALQKQSEAILGENAKQLEQPLRQLTAVRQAFMAVGGTGFGFVFRGPDVNGRVPEPDAFVKLQEGKDADGLIAMVTGMAGNRATVAAVDKATIVVSTREALAKVKPGKQHPAFEKMLAAQENAAIAVAFISSESLRNMVAAEKERTLRREERNPGVAEVFALTEQLVAARQVAGAVVIGPQIKVIATATATDEAAARKLAEQVPASIAMMRKLSQGRASELTLLAALMSGVKVETQGTAVIGTLEGESMQQAARAVTRALFAARTSAREMVSATNIRQLSIAIISFADQNGGKLPDSLDDLADFVGGKEALAKLIAHPTTGEAVGVQYTKVAAKWTDVKMPSATVILREMRGGKVYETGWAGFLDGHIQRLDQPAPAKKIESPR